MGPDSARLAADGPVCFPGDGMFARLTLRAGVRIIGPAGKLHWMREGGDDEGN